MTGKRPAPTIKTIWGLAKSPELQLTSEDLHLLVAGYVGKDSLKELNGREIRLVVQELQRRKDSAKRQAGEIFPGNAVTVRQRKKITQLAEALGWEEEKRVNGLAMKMFGVARVEWLDYQQCSKLAEEVGDMYQICPELLQAIAWKESRYCPEVESKGCTGLMQVAGRWHQERMKELGADNLKDAHQNMLVAADYLQELVETYGDPVMVLMVYNGDSRAEDYWKGHCGPSDYAEEILELSAQLEVQHGK